MHNRLRWLDGIEMTKSLPENDILRALGSLVASGSEVVREIYLEVIGRFDFFDLLGREPQAQRLDVALQVTAFRPPKIGKTYGGDRSLRLYTPRLTYFQMIPQRLGLVTPIAVSLMHLVIGPVRN